MTKPESAGPPSAAPRIPKPKPSLPVRAYAILGSVALGVYLLAGTNGWTFGEEDKDVVPANVRQTPGGYRAFHFWHTGYQGGK